MLEAVPGAAGLGAELLTVGLAMGAATAACRQPMVCSEVRSDTVWCDYLPACMTEDQLARHGDLATFKQPAAKLEVPATIHLPSASCSGSASW